jgi:hypothetical protein
MTLPGRFVEGRRSAAIAAVHQRATAQQQFRDLAVAAICRKVQRRCSRMVRRVQICFSAEQQLDRLFPVRDDSIVQRSRACFGMFLRGSLRVRAGA